ncbi:hypothetical protein FJ938_14910 [Mesorhizobium sp. B2-4-14]|nr:hypothetical protein FJ938_14910 [Mesorhizobium sp. B2-4-14]
MTPASVAASAARKTLQTRAIPGKVRGGFPSGIAKKQRVRADQRFYQTLNRSRCMSPKGDPGFGGTTCI